ncbi:hypothetical protein KI743_03615 [Vibrio sp. D420a]|uniref:hypothetical protein n=1 Tax=Vibrio sp. D420a TaxID=2836895 RepID=UPI0025523EDF|nr:hypothetical protein [Vibrio sp. D420a]MDK9761077.1 hypothetical protein [Vibrio sp. D420a]
MLTLFITQLIILWSAADPIRSIPVLVGSGSTYSLSNRRVVGLIARFSVGVVVGALLLLAVIQHLVGGA